MLLLLPVLVNAQSAHGSVAVINLDGEQRHEIPSDSIPFELFLQNSIGVFEDTTGRKSFEEVAAHPDWFGKNPLSNYNSKEVHWIKVTLEADTAFRDTCLFYIENGNSIASWEWITAYLVHEDGRMERQRTGTGLSREEKTFPTLESVVSFGLDPGERAIMYVRVAGIKPHRKPPWLGMFASRTVNPAAVLKRAYTFSGDYRYGPDRSAFRYNVITDIEVFEATDPALSIAEVYERQEQLPWEDNALNIKPKANKVYWMKTRLLASEHLEGEHIFWVSAFRGDWDAFNYVDVYTSVNKGPLGHQRTGSAVTVSERPYDLWPTFFTVSFAPSDTIDAYIRMETGNQTILPTRISLLHVDPHSVFPRQVKEAKKKMLILGAMLLQLVFLLFLTFVERDRLYIYLTAIVFGGLLVESFNAVRTFFFLPFPGLNVYHMELEILGILIGLLGLLKFTQTFFNYRKPSVHARWIIPFLTCGYLCVTIWWYAVLFNGGVGTAPLNYFYALTGILILYSFYLAIRAKGQPKRLKLIYFIALLPVSVVSFNLTALQVLVAIGVVNTIPFLEWMALLPYSLLFFLTSCALIIGYRKNLLKREKENALKNNLAAQQTIINQLEETVRLEQKDEVKTRFFTNITHEFRTPLTVILGMTEQLRESREKGRSATELNLIERNGKRLLLLINQLLDLAKLDSANLSPSYQNRDVVSFLQYAGESFESLAENKGVELIINGEIDRLDAAIDEVKLQQIIANLLSNAIKFTPPGGTVKLRYGTDNDRLWIRVTDTGAGIAKASLPHVFDRFYQTDNASSRRGEGTGIGLSLVKELLTLLDGTISAKSTLGEGSEFLVTLPVFIVDVPASQPSTITKNEHNLQPLATGTVLADEVSSLPEPAPRSEHDERPQLLIVEDNPDVVFYINSILQSQYDIQVANNGREGIEKAIATIPDIIISDLMMPEMDGLEMCRLLKADERTSHIPIIILTAKATTADRLTGLRTGADAYLMKPFNKEELLVRLAKLIELRQVLRQRFSDPSQLGETTNEPEQLEDHFLMKVRALIEEQIDLDLSIEDVAGRLFLSRVQLYRKIKALTDYSPSQFILRIRLHRGSELLRQSTDTVAEIAYAVGFSDPKYFSRKFKEVYDLAPTTYREED